MHVDEGFKAAIKGKVVKCVAKVDVGGEDWPSIQFTDGSFLILQRDPEGNDPGFGVLCDAEGETIGCIGE